MFINRKILIAGICLLIISLSYFVISQFSQKDKEEKPIQQGEKTEELENHSPKAKTWGTQTGCGIPVAELFFSFLGSDSEDFMTAYQIQIDGNSDFSNCSGQTCVFDTGKETKIEETLKCYGSHCKYSLSEKLPSGVYYWRVKVWDSKDISSDWAQAILYLDR